MRRTGSTQRTYCIATRSEEDRATANGNVHSNATGRIANSAPGTPSMTGSYRTRHNHYDAAGALACARRYSDVTRCNGVVVIIIIMQRLTRHVSVVRTTNRRRRIDMQLSYSRYRHVAIVAFHHALLLRACSNINTSTRKKS